MMRVLLLRFDAPLLSFGGTVVDARNVTDDFPARSMIAGLCANALGHDHRDVAPTTMLQQRLGIAARRDREGERLVDYQTVDLGQHFLLEGWTTAGRAEGREGGTAATGTHIRLRHYLADAVYTLALTLSSPEQSPTLDALAHALDEPARPIFLGRKCCLPSERIVIGIIEADSLLDALVSAPLSPRAKAGRKLVRVPHGSSARGTFFPSERSLTEERDWSNQIHVGRQRVLEGFLAIEEQESLP